MFPGQGNGHVCHDDIVSESVGSCRHMKVTNFREAFTKGGDIVSIRGLEGKGDLAHTNMTCVC